MLMTDFRQCILPVTFIFLSTGQTFFQNKLFTLCHYIIHWHILHETKMDTMGKPDTAYSYIALCNTDGIALCPSRPESFAPGSGGLCLQGNRNADSSGTDRPSFSPQFVGAGGGGHSAAGHLIVFREPECACTGVAAVQGQGGSG